MTTETASAPRTRNPKAAAREIIDHLPDNATWEEVFDALSVQRKNKRESRGSTRSGGNTLSMQETAERAGRDFAEILREQDEWRAKRLAELESPPDEGEDA